MVPASKRVRTLAIAGQVVRFAVDTRREAERLAALASEEGRLLARLLDVTDDGDSFYDVGANIGTVALPVAVASRGRCVALEADPANAARLTENAALNGLENVTVLELAAWREPATLGLRGEGPVGTGTHVVSSDHRGGSRPVQATSLDELVRRGHPPPRVVKVDVEGGELEVLRGAVHTLEAGCVHDLFVEVHPAELAERGAGDEELTRFLAELGYVKAWEARRATEIHRHFRAREVRRDE